MKNPEGTIILDTKVVVVTQSVGIDSSIITGVFKNATEATEFAKQWEKDNGYNNHGYTITKLSMLEYNPVFKPERNNSENRRKYFDKLFIMLTGEEPKVHHYSETARFIREMYEKETRVKGSE